MQIDLRMPTAIAISHWVAKCSPSPPPRITMAYVQVKTVTNASAYATKSVHQGNGKILEVTRDVYVRTWPRYELS